MHKSHFFLLIAAAMIFMAPSLGQSTEMTLSSPSQATEASIREELNKVKDPETGGPLPAFVPIDRVTLENGRALIEVRIPSHCPLKKEIVRLIKDRVSAMEGIDQVEVVSLSKAKKPVKKARISPAVDTSKPRARLPVFSRISVEPLKVYPGDTMSVSVKVKDPAGVVSVSANMGDVETIALALKKGSKHNGTWEGTWKVHDTLQKNYVTTLKAVNAQGAAAFAHAGWSDAVAWWDNAYLFRKQLTVVNNTASTLTTGYTVWGTIGTSGMIAVNNMQADADDLRVLYWNGASYVELDRHVRYLNTAFTEVYFKTQADISGSSADANYYIYYGNASATNPPANAANVYEYWEPFDNLTGWTTLYGSPSVSGGIVTMPNASVIYHDMGYLGNVYNKVFEQYVSSNLSSTQAMWWGMRLRAPVSSWYCGYQCCDGASDGWKDLMLVTSVVNTVHKNSLTAATNPGTGVDETRSTSWAPGAGYNVYSQKWKANEVKHYHNRQLWATHALDVSTSSYNAFMEFWNYSSSTSFTVDWAAARPYVDPEPTTILGRQEGPETRVGGASIGGAVIR